MLHLCGRGRTWTATAGAAVPAHATKLEEQPAVSRPPRSHLWCFFSSQHLLRSFPAISVFVSHSWFPVFLGPLACPLHLKRRTIPSFTHTHAKRGVTPPQHFLL